MLIRILNFIANLEPPFFTVFYVVVLGIVGFIGLCSESRILILLSLFIAVFLLCVRIL